MQVTNESGSKVVKAKINDASDSNTSNLVAYASITGPTICNIAKGPIILEESDALTLETDTVNVKAVVSILEISREDQMAKQKFTHFVPDRSLGSVRVATKNRFQNLKKRL